MTRRTEISLEMAKLTQRTAKRINVPFLRELARSIAEQAVLELDCELNFILDSSQSLSTVDTLTRAIPVNDIVINGRHIDVALLDKGDNKIALATALAMSSYSECGSLIVRLFDATSGAIVGYVDGALWSQAASANPEASEVELEFTAGAFDLATCLQSIESTHSANVNKPLSIGAAEPKAEDYLQFLRDRHVLPVARQRLVIEALMAKATARENLSLLVPLGSDQLPAVLQNAAVWQARVDQLVSKLSVKFQSLTAEQIAIAVRIVGEKYGGQPEAPQFKQELIRSLAKQQFSMKLSPAIAQAMNVVIERVMSGKKAVDAVKDFMKNDVAVDLALIINEKRRHVRDFAAATADEIGFAFQQLALSPAYATHSSDETSSVDDINNALELMQAAEIVEEWQNLEV